MSNRPLTLEQVQYIIKDRMGLDIDLHPVPDMVFSNQADYQSDLLNNYPYLYNARYYSRTMFEKVDVFLTFDNEVQKYNSGLFRCDGRHYIVLLEDEPFPEGS
jgi:hypothetical protein